MPNGDNSYINQQMMNIITSHTTEEIDLEHFLKLETIGINPEELEEHNEDYMGRYKETEILFRDHRYETKLPWKDDQSELLPNFQIAKKRTEPLLEDYKKSPNGWRSTVKI